MEADVRLIAAVGRSGQIGLNGKLPWNDPADLAWFKETTAGGYIVVGGVTYASTPSFRSNNRVKVGWGRIVNPEGLIMTLQAMDAKRTIWIAGGRRTYEAFMPFVKRFYISRIDYDGPADTFMPPLWSATHGPDPQAESYSVNHPSLGTITGRFSARDPNEAVGPKRPLNETRAAQSIHAGDLAPDPKGPRS